MDVGLINSYNKGVSDWRDTMMSKAEFNAMAAERRANRAGSGFDSFGGIGSLTYYNNINEGISTPLPTTNAQPNKFYLDPNGTVSPLTSINGVVSKLKSIYSTGWAEILLPPAPTVLPYDAVLTQQQIDSGVIKHADASNSGLIVNGKFDTDTSGWTAKTAVASTITWVSGEMVCTAVAAYGGGLQGFPTIVGKKYIFEFDMYRGIGTGIVEAEIVGSTGSNIISLVAITSDTKTRYYAEYVAIATTTYLGFRARVAGEIVKVDNIAVFPSDAISRSDLVFLESWHEDVSEKDFVYPLGNVQYLGTTGDAGTTSAGAFAGSATYSLFSDTWQADDALVGKGYVWSTLSDANKKAFVANPENNCYLDGDKVIQVRYRVRVVVGMGDKWRHIAPNIVNTSYNVENALFYDTFGSYSLDGTIKPKGKKTSVPFDIGSYTEGLYMSSMYVDSVYNIPNKQQENGVFNAVTNGWGSYASVGYEGKCYALPIALVHRRNQGGYNLPYNPHGTKTMTMTPTSIADCFNPANYTATTGYIGTSTSRPDGLFYDQVSVEDFKPANKGADLRNSSKKRTAQNIIEEFAPKVIAGTIPYFNNDTTALTTYKDAMEVRDTSGNRYPLLSKVGNVATIGVAVANKKGFTVVTQNGKQYLQVADDVASDATVQMNLSTIKYDIGVFDA